MLIRKRVEVVGYLRVIAVGAERHDVIGERISLCRPMSSPSPERPEHNFQTKHNWHFNTFASKIQYIKHYILNK